MKVAASAGLIVATLLALPIQAAETPRVARVAGGAKVQLQASTRTPAQWATARPGARDLRPKPRGTFE